MKHLLLTTIAAVVLVGCGESQQSSSPAEAKTAEPVAEATKPITPPKAVTANKGADPARGIKPERQKRKVPERRARKVPDTIYRATRRGNIEAVKKHLADGADVNEKNDDGVTPLHSADTKEIAELLIANGADVNEKNDDGVTPLHYAALKGHKEIVELLIAKGADVNAKDDEGATPLHSAAYGGHKEIVELLIAKGADVNAKGRYGRTPLHRAAPSGSKEMIELLIANGADVNAMNHDETPLDSHWSFGLKEPTERSALLRKHGGKTGSELSIVIAASRRELKTVQQHIANGVDVNTTHDGGVTALHHAVNNRDRKLVQSLIDNGANVNARDESGSTPLEWCEGDKRTSDILRKHGGKTSDELDNKKPEGKPAHDTEWAEKESLSMALFQAAIDGNVDMLKQHLEDGAEINQTGIGYGATPLSMALAGGHLAASKLLIEKGANVNAIVDGGGNLLFFIAPSGRKDLVELLLNNGAKVNHTNKYGKTPLDEAKRHPQITDLLRKHGGKTGEELKAEGK